jgi:hypothetical protein
MFCAVACSSNAQYANTRQLTRTTRAVKNICELIEFSFALLALVNQLVGIIINHQKHAASSHGAQSLLCNFSRRTRLLKEILQMRKMKN